MVSLCVMTGDKRLLLRFGGAMSLRTWSLVRTFSLPFFFFGLRLLRVLSYESEAAVHPSLRQLAHERLYVVSFQMATSC
jgi:hypothetical protein